MSGLGVSRLVRFIFTFIATVTTLLRLPHVLLLAAALLLVSGHCYAQSGSSLESRDATAWDTALQYRRSLLPPFEKRSLIDSPEFFLSKDGKQDAQKELEASIRAIEESRKATLPVETEVQCQFPARYQLLRSIYPDRIPSLSLAECSRFREWREGLSAEQITLVYPASYLNNPASMFGHTFLRIDAKGQDESTRMLAYAANYGAMTNERNGILFSLKGLLGGYRAAYTIAPYYRLIDKYSDREYRDIWEYTLDLSQSEVDAVIALLWDYSSASSQYFFLDENCSYQLLFLLDFVRPELSLVDAFPLWAIPSDTVKEIASHRDLIRKVVYRPSAATILRHQTTEASRDVIALAESIVDGEMRAEEVVEASSDSGYTEKTKRESLALASSVLSYETLRAKPGARRDELAVRAHEVLLAQSRLASNSAKGGQSDASVFSAVPVPQVRPDQGHSTLRTTHGVGYGDDSWFSEHSVRFAYHDLLDPAGGYLPGASIAIFDLRLRLEEFEDLHLESFTPVAIQSLAPRDSFIKPISWSLSLGVERQKYNTESDSEHTYAAVLEGGPGLSYALGSKGLFWILSDLAMNYSGEYDKGNLALGVGGRLGAYFDTSDTSRFLFEAGSQRVGGADSYTAFKLGGALSLSIDKNVAVVVEASRQSELSHYWSEVLASVRLYF